MTLETIKLIGRGFHFVIKVKALHSELLTELSSQFSSRNEFFAISEFRVERHFFVIFGKFGISKFLKFPKFPNIRKNQFPKFPNFFRTYFRIFPNFLTENQVFLTKKTGFFDRKTQIYIIFFEIFIFDKKFG